MRVLLQPTIIHDLVPADRSVHSAVRGPWPFNRCESGDRRAVARKPDGKRFRLFLNCEGGRRIAAERKRQV